MLLSEQEREKEGKREKLCGLAVRGWKQRPWLECTCKGQGGGSGEGEVLLHTCGWL